MDDFQDSKSEITKRVILGDSMSPTLLHGEKVLVSIKEDYFAGDLVCFHLPGCSDLIIHRIVKIYQDMFYACGDNRFIPDIGVKRSYILGKVENKCLDNQYIPIDLFKRFILITIFIKICVLLRVFGRYSFKNG